jgi:predicted transcriptional regulator
MQTEVQTVPPSIRVDQFVDDYVYRHHFKMFPVADNGRLVGCMTTRKLRDLGRDQWSDHTVEELAEGCSEENTVSADDDATKALAKMNNTGNSRLIVVSDDNLEGIISLKDLMKFISLKVELEG